MAEATTVQVQKWYTHPPMRNALISGLIIGLTIAGAHFDVFTKSVEILLFLVASVIGGYHWVREGIEELREDRRVDIEILMLAAAIGAAILGMFEEAALLVFIYSAAEGLEEYTFAKTRASIRALLDLAPKHATRLIDGKEEKILATELKLGEVFLVRPGESMPTDGIIVKGSSSVDEAPVTGESMPVEKTEGMKVYAATINQEGALEVKVTAGFTDNSLSKMVHMVEEAQDKKSKAQVFINRFGQKYSPAVLIFGLGLMVVPPLLGFSFEFWAERAIVFLVAAAPCALVMSTPVAVASGIGSAGKRGVLVKGGMHLENLGKVAAVALDKTGTLTSGKPVVTDIVPTDGTSDRLLKIAASVEQFSEHPLARAIVKAASERNLHLAKATNFTSKTGVGAQATIGKETILVGQLDQFKSYSQEFINVTEKLRLTGKTVIYVGSRSNLHGAIAIRDEMREDSRKVVEGLHSLGLKVVMLTGDNEVTARAIAKEIGIDDVRANLKPEDKVNAIESLKKEYRAVAMVGDGINDAPALASSTVGMAMGTAGTDAAIEAADVALMADDLSKVVYAVELGKRAQGISTQNIVFSLLLLVVLIPSALIGIMTITVAVIVHEAGELLAISNGLRVARQP